MTGPTVEGPEGAVPAVAGAGQGPAGAAIHAVEANYDTIFTWDYRKAARPALSRLYEKAKASMWNGETDLAWDTPVDQEAIVTAEDPYLAENLPRPNMANTPFANWGRREWLSLGMESQNWTLSQFMHGEQGGLVCGARIVETVPWVDAKFYAATQVMDEARHLEVFSRYLDTKLSGHYPVNPHLLALLDDIIADSRWDITYLGMQIMVEGLALAAFGMIRETTVEPLLKQILTYVMADEARHVAFGVTSLKGIYQQLSASEIRERQEFALDAAIRMRDRLLQEEVWERMGVPALKVRELMLQSHDQQMFRQLLFCKIVPNCRKLGLLDAGDGWLRKRFTDLGVIQFEHWSDSAEEIRMFQLVDGVANAT
jgi:P-aminobenzoate N-oxygenase AurF